LPALRSAIDNQYYDFTLTGTSVVAAEGTQYLVKNLLTSLFFAIIIISVLMAVLFRSWRMVVASLIPNFVPLIVTAGVMGFFHIPIKPSTILVFSIAFGISVDDTIHFLAKYRMELKYRAWAQSECVVNSLKETGLSMFYTSIILFCGFNMFSLSQFGGTQALGMLVSLTLIVAMVTNLVLLPTILLSLHRWLNSKSFQEPYFQFLEEEEDIELNALQIEGGVEKPNE
jgi:predicted RND superfamily exporter protein